MKKRIGFFVLALTIMLCAHAMGAGTVSDTLGEFRNEALIEGFAVPVPADTERFRLERTSDHYLSCRSTDASAPNSLYIDAYVFDPMDEFAETGEAAEKIYNSQSDRTNPEYEEENVLVYKHAARICVYRGKGDAGDYSVGVLRYARNNRLLQIRLYSEPQNGTSWEDLPRITLDDMRTLAEHLVYDPDRASVTENDGEFTLQAKGGSEYLTAGKSLKLEVVFTHPEKIVKSSWNTDLKWSVKDDATGGKPVGVTISKKGELTAERQINGTMNVTVTAESKVFHTTAEIRVSVVPALKKLYVRPTRISIYTDQKEPVIISTVPEPSTVPPVGITWSSAKAGVVEIVPDEENGTAGILPLKAGQTVITAQGPGGKSAQAAVSVMKAVEEVKLTASGRAVPYGVVTVRASLEPKDATNRTMKWSLDVSPQIATINKGQVIIGGKVEPGTVITVTCTALGASEPVVGTIRIEVEKR